MAGNDKLTGLITRIIECDDVELSGYAEGPERSLLSALLFDGIQSYFSYALNDSPAMKDKYKEAFNWVQSNDQEYVFSFCNVCEAVGVNPQSLRLGLLNYVNSNRAAMIQSIPTPALEHTAQTTDSKVQTTYRRARRTG
jgi:hypothetical protein